MNNLERNGSVGNRAFLDGQGDQLKIWVVFGRFFVLSPKKSISRTRVEIEIGPNHGGASGCIAPTTNLAASARNLQNIKDRKSGQPIKDVVGNNEKQVNLRNRFLTFQNKEASHS